MGRVTSSKPAMLAAGIAGVAGQILFTLGWFMAGVFQGDAYSVVRHDISDMGALGAPYPWVLLIPQSIAGACTIVFGVVGPALVGTRGRTLATTLLVLPPWCRELGFACLPLGLSRRRWVHRRRDCEVMARDCPLDPWSFAACCCRGSVRRRQMLAEVTTMGSAQP